MRKTFCAALSILFISSVSTAFGADFWETKEYTKWSSKECGKMLENSPWAKDFSLVAAGLQRSAGASDDGQQFYIKYQLQFRSALPVRQALVRQMQIAQKYDSLSPEQKQQFDKSAESFLSSNFPDAVILYVTYDTNSQSIARELDRHWQSRTADLLRNTVFLRNSRGQQVALAQFAVSQGSERSFQFIFPRKVDGEPFLKADDKSLQLEFSYPVVSAPGGGGSLGDGRAFVEFKPQKMIFKGDLVY